MISTSASWYNISLRIWEIQSVLHTQWWFFLRYLWFLYSMICLSLSWFLISSLLFRSIISWFYNLLSQFASPHPPMKIFAVGFFFYLFLFLIFLVGAEDRSRYEGSQYSLPAWIMKVTSSYCYKETCFLFFTLLY